MELSPIDLEAVLVLNHKGIKLRIAELHGFQIETAAEGALLAVVTGPVGNDLLHVADLQSIVVGEIQQVCRLFAIASNRLLLIEIKGENHVADLPAG